MAYDFHKVAVNCAIITWRGGVVAKLEGYIGENHKERERGGLDVKFNTFEHVEGQYYFFIPVHKPEKG